MNGGLIGGIVASIVVALFVPWWLKRKAQRMEAPREDVTFKAFWGVLFVVVMLVLLSVFVVAVCVFSLIFSDVDWWISMFLIAMSLAMCWVCYTTALGLKDKIVVGPSHLLIMGASNQTVKQSEWQRFVHSQRCMLDLKWTDIKSMRLVKMLLYIDLNSGESYSVSIGPYDSKLVPMISKFINVHGL